MIKNYIVNKLNVISISCILLLLFSLIPTTTIKDVNINNDRFKNVVYLLDKDNYVSKVITYYDKDSVEESIKYRIDVLINGLKDFDIFYPLIPKNTKINNITIDKNNVYIDFNEELLNVSKYQEEEMIESIIYTLTEINGIDNIYITVNSELLEKLPYSNKILNYPLTKNYGINKEYNINSFNDINKTTIVYTKEINKYKYEVPITKITNSTDDKINIIVEELKNKRIINKDVYLDKFNISNKKMNLVFNRIDNIKEEAKDILTMSILENYDVNDVIFSIK